MIIASVSLVGAFNQEKALVGALSVIVKSSRNLREPSFEALLFSLSLSQAMPARPHFNVYFMTLNVKHRNE